MTATTWGGTFDRDTGAITFGGVKMSLAELALVLDIAHKGVLEQIAPAGTFTHTATAGGATRAPALVARKF